MGVPAFFRWLSRKYPSIVVNCVEEKPKVLKGVKIPVDSSKPNPNNYEFDNLYLDMNGIIHPCCHPEDKPAPKNEDEMMVLIFEYIDRIFSIVRPRKLLYMAIDGVAPRAKMNQQRSRRFRAAKEAVESSEEIARMRAELEAMGCYLPPSKPAGERFDSNCITPGTPFMSRLADCLRYYIHDRLNNDAGWQGIKVILSDANVPGEGEHKIMDYIRKQRGQPNHDPNTRHCLCGADADLIMLGLATHEPNFTIIREEFKPNKPRPCALCGQLGHEMKECKGLPKSKEGEFDELSVAVGEEQEFIFLRLNILREYLERELLMDGLPFPYDFERALDDWVFMCFFVGNDFLPHLPSLEIREGAIDRLVRLYKNTVRKTGGYLTNSGVVNLERVQLVMSDLGEVEDEIFKKRRETELDFRRRDKEKKKRMRRTNDKPRYIPGGQFAPKPLGRYGSPDAISNPRQQAYQMRTQGMHTSAVEKNLGKLDSAEALKSMMTSGGDPHGQKRGLDEDNEDEEEPQDDVKLWEDGWKDRYYKSKFDVDSDDITFRHTVANHYVIGLCWVLRYYYQGCSSWKWYFPYHYAPFASDFVNIGVLPNDFEKGTKPFKPLEQLMGVFPAASKQHIPVTWQRLMCDPESSIIDFYPVDFKIDLNGKKFAWQGVALLPFVDEKRLLAALKYVYRDLTLEEQKRNEWGSDRLFVGTNHPSHDFFEGLYEGKGTQEPVSFDCKLTQGMAGTVWCDEFVVLTGETVRSPLPTIPDLPNNAAISVQFKDPQYDPNYLFKAVVLKGAKTPPRTLKPEDFNKNNPGQYYRPQLGFTPGSGYREKDISAGLRMIRHNLGSGSEGEVPMNYRNQGYQSDQRAVNAQNRDTRFSQQSANIGWSRNLQGQTGAYSKNQQQQGEQRGYNRGYNSGYTQGNMGSNQGYSQGSRGYGQGSNDHNQGYSQGSRGYSQGSNDQGSRGYGQGSYNQGSRGYGQGGSNQSQQSYGQIPSYNTAQGQRSSYSSGGTRDNRGYGNQSNSQGAEIPPPPFYKSNRR